MSGEKRKRAHSNEISGNLEENEIHRLLEQFVKSFVEKFENKLDEFTKEAAVGASAKVGKSAKLVGGAIGTVATCIGGPKEAAEVVSEPIQRLIGKSHREKSKAIVERLGIIDSDNLREILAEAAGEVFWCFQHQFSKATDDEGRKLRAMIKFADDAVYRSINCINAPGDINCDFICKGVIEGKSKKGFLVKLTEELHLPKRFCLAKAGRKLSVDCYTSELFEGTGLLIEGSSAFLKYKKIRGDKSVKYGYRLKFAWESLDSYKQDGSLNDFKYILEKSELKRSVKAILSNINGIEHKLKSIMDRLNQFSLRKAVPKSPIYFGIQDPVESFIGRRSILDNLHQLLQEKGNTVISQMLCISGLGGIGKTELVRKYIQNNADVYQAGIVWINAETRESLDTSFRGLYGKMFGQIKEQVKIADRDSIYENFPGGYGLFIFDNACEYNVLKEFLPRTSLNINRLIRYLITSRNKDWKGLGEIHLLHLELLSEDESVALIKELLKSRNDLNDGDVRQLAQRLQNLPLALKHAVAYIHKRNSKYGITDYIKDLDKKGGVLLKFEDVYTETVYTTWTITMNTIKSEEKYGKLAKLVLNIISYLAPHNIQKEIFSNLHKLNIESLQEDNFEFNENLDFAIELLNQYSMISTGTEITVHRLVQEVTRLQLIEEKQNENTVHRTFNLLNLSLKDKEKNVERRKLIPHFEALLTCVEQQSETKGKFEIYPDLLISMGETYYKLNDVKRSNELLTQALSEMDKLPAEVFPVTEEQRKKYLKVAKVTKTLANVKGDMGMPEDKIDLLQKVLRAFKNYGTHILEEGKVLRNIANARGDLGEHKEKLDMLNEAYDIYKNHEANDIQMAKLRRNMAIALGYLGNHEEMKSILQKEVIEVLEKELKKKPKRKKKRKIEKMKNYDIKAVYAKALLNLAIAYASGDKKQCDNTKINQCSEQAKKILEELYPNEGIEFTKQWVKIGELEGLLGFNESSVQILELCKNALSHYLGRDHFETAKALVKLGDAEGKSGNYDKQIEHQEKALKIQRHHYGDSSFEVIKTMEKLCTAYHIKGYFEKEVNLLVEIKESCEKKEDKENVDKINKLLQTAKDATHTPMQIG